MQNVMTMVRRAAVALVVGAQLATAQTTTTWTGSEPTMTQRLLRDGNASVAGINKLFPGTVEEDVSFLTFTFVNPFSSTATFFAGFVGETGSSAPFFSLYLNSFNPTALATNYLGDSGSSCIGSPCSVATSFGVNVAANATVVLVANSVNDFATEGDTFTWTQRWAPATVVPEPSTYALLGTGLVALVAVARRRRTA